MAMRGKEHQTQFRRLPDHFLYNKVELKFFVELAFADRRSAFGVWQWVMSLNF